jgi:hypothetical protein
MRTSLAAQMSANPLPGEADVWKAEFAVINEEEGTYGKIRLTVSAITDDRKNCGLSIRGR